MAEEADQDVLSTASIGLTDPLDILSHARSVLHKKVEGLGNGNIVIGPAHGTKDYSRGSEDGDKFDIEDARPRVIARRGQDVQGLGEIYWANDTSGLGRARLPHVHEAALFCESVQSQMRVQLLKQAEQSATAPIVRRMNERSFDIMEAFQLSEDSSTQQTTITKGVPGQADHNLRLATNVEQPDERSRTTSEGPHKASRVLGVSVNTAMCGTSPVPVLNLAALSSPTTTSQDATSPTLPVQPSPATTPSPTNTGASMPHHHEHGQPSRRPEATLSHRMCASTPQLKLRGSPAGSAPGSEHQLQVPPGISIHATRRSSGLGAPPGDQRLSNGGASSSGAPPHGTHAPAGGNHLKDPVTAHMKHIHAMLNDQPGSSPRRWSVDVPGSGHPPSGWGVIAGSSLYESGAGRGAAGGRASRGSATLGQQPPAAAQQGGDSDDSDTPPTPAPSVLLLSPRIACPSLPKLTDLTRKHGAQHLDNEWLQKSAYSPRLAMAGMAHVQAAQSLWAAAQTPSAAPATSTPAVGSAPTTLTAGADEVAAISSAPTCASRIYAHGVMEPEAAFAEVHDPLSRARMMRMAAQRQQDALALARLGISSRCSNFTAEPACGTSPSQQQRQQEQHGAGMAQVPFPRGSIALIGRLMSGPSSSNNIPEAPAGPTAGPTTVGKFASPRTSLGTPHLGGAPMGSTHRRRASLDNSLLPTAGLYSTLTLTASLTTGSCSTGQAIIQGGGNQDGSSPEPFSWEEPALLSVSSGRAAAPKLPVMHLPGTGASGVAGPTSGTSSPRRMSLDSPRGSLARGLRGVTPGMAAVRATMAPTAPPSGRHP